MLLLVIIKVPITKVVIFLFIEDSTSIVDAATMILTPNLFDSGGGLSLDHGHLHDLSEFARTGVGE